MAVLRLIAELKSGWQLDWKITRFLAIENSGDVIARSACGVGDARRVAYQAAGCGELTKRIHRRNGVEASQRHQLFAGSVEERGVCKEKCPDSLPYQGPECCIDLLLVAGIQEDDLQAKSVCRLLFRSALRVSEDAVVGSKRMPTEAAFGTS